jgi:hypothetical protein
MDGKGIGVPLVCPRCEQVLRPSPLAFISRRISCQECGPLWDGYGCTEGEDETVLRLPPQPVPRWVPVVLVALLGICVLVIVSEPTIGDGSVQPLHERLIVLAALAVGLVFAAYKVGGSFCVSTTRISLRAGEITIAREPIANEAPARYRCTAVFSVRVVTEPVPHLRVAGERLGPEAVFLSQQDLPSAIGNGLPPALLAEVATRIQEYVEAAVATRPTAEEVAAQIADRLAARPEIGISRDGIGAADAAATVIVQKRGDGVRVVTHPVSPMYVVFGVIWLAFAVFWTVGVTTGVGHPFLAAAGVLLFYFGARLFFTRTVIDLAAGGAVVRSRLLRLIPWSLPFPRRLALDDIVDVAPDLFGAPALVTRERVLPVAGIRAGAIGLTVLALLRHELVKHGWQRRRRFRVKTDDASTTITLAPAGLLAFAEISGRSAIGTLAAAVFCGVIPAPLLGALPLFLLGILLEDVVDFDVLITVAFWVLMLASAWFGRELARSQVRITRTDVSAAGAFSKPQADAGVLVVERRIWRWTLRTHRFDPAAGVITIEPGEIVGETQAPAPVLTVCQGEKRARVGIGLPPDDLEALRLALTEPPEEPGIV